MTRPVDKKATAAARKRHAAGVARLAAIFGTPESAAELRRDRRLVGGGPAFPAVFTRRRWSRPRRRAKTKAQRLARRRNRA